VGDELEKVALHAEDERVIGAADPGRVLCDGVHDRLEVGRRARDHPQDLARSGLLLLRFCQALLQLAAPGGFAPQRLAEDGSLGFELCPCGLRPFHTPRHRALLAGLSVMSRAAIDDRLSEGRLVGKWEWPGVGMAGNGRVSCWLIARLTRPGTEGRVAVVSLGR
jgi:hypothetical protein